MSIDEFLFGKIAKLIRINKEKDRNNSNTVYLNEIQKRLTLLACAISGKSIKIYPAVSIGGYQDDVYFLPGSMNSFVDFESNIQFYFFRIAYMTVQQHLNLNNFTDVRLSDDVSIIKARESSSTVLSNLFNEFPIFENIHSKFYNHIIANPNKLNLSILYGKWFNDSHKNSSEKLDNIGDYIKRKIDSTPKTILISKPVEEIINLEVDIKQQEDYVLNHNFEKVETADEFSGTWRDFDGDDELEKHKDAINELNLKYTVRVDDTAHSIYQTDFVENINVGEAVEIESSQISIKYPEWDYKNQKYKFDFCSLFPKLETELSSNYYIEAIKKNTVTLNSLRKIISSLNNEWAAQSRQLQGSEFDIDATTDMFVQLHSGHTPSENIYNSTRKNQKSISILLLLDLSLSSDGYVAGNRIIDVEKQTAILFGEILNEHGIDFSIMGFYSKTRNHSSYITLKGFDEKWDLGKLKIGSPAPNGYTRIGTSLRHSGALISSRNTKKKWIILLSDGKPNDFDKYEGKYGINDVKQSIRELASNNIQSYAVAIEANAKYYLPQMFGQNHYQILSSPKDLITSLVKLYDKIRK